MEDTLREELKKVRVEVQSLNPCFNGRYSQRYEYKILGDGKVVLILVLMEDTLRDFIQPEVAHDTNQS